MLKTFSFFLVFMLSICGNPASQIDTTNQTQSKENKELSLKMERFGCYGRCPVYSLEIQNNGKVIFDGKFWTKTIGKTEDNLTKEQINQLITEIEKADFFTLQNKYNNSPTCPTIATDSASVMLSVQIDGKSKTIDHYLGCYEKDLRKQNDSGNVRVEKEWTERIFPQQLYRLESKIDEIVETKRWIGNQE